MTDQDQKPLSEEEQIILRGAMMLKLRDMPEFRTLMAILRDNANARVPTVLSQVNPKLGFGAAMAIEYEKGVIAGLNLVPQIVEHMIAERQSMLQAVNAATDADAPEVEKAK